MILVYNIQIHIHQHKGERFLLFDFGSFFVTHKNSHARQTKWEYFNNDNSNIYPNREKYTNRRQRSKKKTNILFMDFRFCQNSGLKKKTERNLDFIYLHRSIISPAEHFFKTLFIRLWHLSRFINYRYWTHCLCICYRKSSTFEQNRKKTTRKQNKTKKRRTKTRIWNI